MKGRKREEENGGWRLNNKIEYDNDDAVRAVDDEENRWVCWGV